MKKYLAVGCLLVVVAGVAAAWWMWREATAMPQWATEQLEHPQPPSQGPVMWRPEFSGPTEKQAENQAEEPSGERASEPPAAGSRPAESGSTARKPTRYVLRGFHRKTQGAAKNAVRTSRAVLENGKLEAGVVLDLSRLDGRLSETDRSVLDRAVEAFPGLAKRNVYIGLEDRPVRTNGTLKLGRAPKLRIGNVRLSLPGAAKKLGMTESQLREQFDRALRQFKL